MNRRNFLQTLTGVAIAGAAIDLSSVRSISAKSRVVAPDVREVPINLEDNPDLKPVGGTYHLTVDDMEREILVVHTKPNEYIAVDIKCKHRGCDINYEAADKKFVCPCHGSEYDLTGANLKGPAKEPLNYYHAELKGNEVIVTVYGANDPVPANSVRPKAAPVQIDTTAVKSDSTIKPDSTKK
jgi:Rieske Fe-S protein